MKKDLSRGRFVFLSLISLAGASLGSPSQAMAMSKGPAKPTPVPSSTSSPSPSSNPSGTPVAAFPDAETILTTQDITGTLQTLKAYAQANDDYHQKLLKVIQDASTIDVAHLNLLLDACFYSFDQYVKLLADIDQLRNQQSDPTKFQQLQDDETLLDSMNRFGSYVNYIANVGMPKASDLSVQGGTGLLKKLFPSGNATQAFQAVAKLESPFPLDQEVPFADFAVSKGEDSFAGGLDLDWFNRSQDHSLDALKTLDAHLKSSGRNILVNGALGYYPTPSAQDILTLAGLTYGSYSSTVIIEERKIKNLSVDDVILLSSNLSGDDKNTVVSYYIGITSSFSTKDIERLAGASYGMYTSDILNNIGKIKDFNEANAIAIAQNDMSGDSKNQVINDYIANQKSFTTGDIESLAAATYGEYTSTILNHLNVLTDFNQANAIRIATNDMSGDAKNQVINTYMKGQASYTTAQLELLASATYGEYTSTLLNNLGKLTDFTQANAIHIATADLSGDDKNQVINAYMKGQSLYSTAALELLASATYGEYTSTLLNNLGRLSDFSLQNCLKITNDLSGDSRNTVVQAYLDRTSQLSTQDLLQLASATYGEYTSVVLNNNSKLTDFTVANAIFIAQQLSGSDKNTFLLAAIDRVTDLNMVNLSALADASYGDRNEILAKGANRLGQK